MMRHSETKPYKCKHCVYSSIQAVQLKYHIRTNHPEEYETIVCSLCPFSSINKELLARHLRDHKAGLVKFDDEAKEGSNNTEDKASKLQDPKPIIEVEWVTQKCLPVLRLCSICSAGFFGLLPATWIHGLGPRPSCWHWWRHDPRRRHSVYHFQLNQKQLICMIWFLYLLLFLD